MTSLVPPKVPVVTDEQAPVVAQEKLPVEEPPILASGAQVTPQEPPQVSRPAVPPAPPGGPYTARRRGPSGGSWAWGIALVVFGGLAWWLYGFAVAAVGFDINGGKDFATMALATLVAAVPALPCLLAGWLLRSWLGMVAAAVVYIAVSAVMWVLAIGGGPSGMTFWTVGFALAVVLPAVVLAAIGTAIGMYRTR